MFLWTTAPHLVARSLRARAASRRRTRQLQAPPAPVVAAVGWVGGACAVPPPPQCLPRSWPPGAVRARRARPRRALVRERVASSAHLSGRCHHPHTSTPRRAGAPATHHPPSHQCRRPGARYVQYQAAANVEGSTAPPRTTGTTLLYTPTARQASDGVATGGAPPAHPHTPQSTRW